MKNILLLAVIALIGTAAHAQSTASDKANEEIGKSSSSSDTQATATSVGCPGGKCNKNLVQTSINKNTNPGYKGSNSTTTTPADSQGGTR